MRLVSLLVASLLLVGPATSARAEVAVDSDHVLVISSLIAEGNLLPFGARLLQLASSEKEGDSQVDLVIHSPGGEVETGFIFISMMDQARARGLHIRCFVPALAASMAFSILNHCDERYVLDHSFLLFHRARVLVGGMMGAPMTGPVARLLAEDLERLDSTIFEETASSLQISRQTVLHHFDAETLHSGSDLCKMAPKYCVSLPVIPGLFEALLSKQVPHTQNARLGIRGNGRGNPVPVYISDRILRSRTGGR